MPNRRIEPQPQPADTAAPFALAALTSLSGVGPKKAASLAAAGIASVRDLLLLEPRGYECWEERSTIAEAREQLGRRAIVRAEVTRVRLTRLGGKRSLVRVSLEDATGTIDALFFNQPWMREHVTAGETYEFAGNVVDSKGPTLATPKLGTPAKPLPPAGTVQPIYPPVEGWSQDGLAGVIAEAVERFADRLLEPVPEERLDELNLPPLAQAVHDIHAPRDLASFGRARRRLTLETLIRIQCRIQGARSARRRTAARPVRVDAREHAQIMANFPFQFTDGQAQIARELRADLARREPMRRLFQGDVGSGKTAVALYAALAVARAGGQVAFMAPTELLAEQHYYGLRGFIHDAGCEAELVSGSLPKDERRNVTRRLATGDVQILFGTHALFSKDIRFHRLDLVVIDEQHRFGVGQRAALLDKGTDVHVLLMTATPIPRTLALTVYGDLDTSVLREHPPGRGRVKTRWVRGHDKRRVPKFLAERLAEGEQIYWVCPRIGDDESTSKLASAEKRYEQLAKTELAEIGIELVHGRIPQDERAHRLNRFRQGEVGLLVATTVIEVGVDVPSATVMVIENAERLGLAQLHQLRGRVGRGPADSWCLLYGKDQAAERFELLEQTNDGFELAEEDLRRRGMGDLAGVRQSGVNAEGLTDLEQDLDLLLAARDLVRELHGLRRAYARHDGLAPVAP